MITLMDETNDNNHVGIHIITLMKETYDTAHGGDI